MAELLFELIGSLSESASEGLSDSSCGGISESNRGRDKHPSDPADRPDQRSHTACLTLDDLRQIPISS